MNSSQQHSPTEFLSHSDNYCEKDLKELTHDSRSQDSDEDGIYAEILPDFVDLNEIGQSEPLRFHKLSDSSAVESRYNWVCPFCAEKCSEPVCESATSSLGCKFRAHLYCMLTLDISIYKTRGYPIDLPSSTPEVGTVSNQYVESTVTPSRVSLSLVISHPLTNLSFVALEKRIPIFQKSKGERFISWSLTKESNTIQRGYEPNYVCLPLTDFRVELEIDLNLSNKPKIYDFVVAFNPEHQTNKKYTMFCKSGPVAIEMDIYMTDFKPILSLMNYKYKYTDSPIIVIRNLICEIEQVAPAIEVPEIVAHQAEEQHLLQNYPSHHPSTPQFYEYSKAKSMQGNYPVQDVYGFDNSNQFLNQSYNYMSPDIYSVYSNKYMNPNYSMSSEQHYMSHQAYPTYGMGQDYNKYQERSTAQTMNYKPDEAAENSLVSEAALNSRQVLELIQTNQLKAQASTNNGSRQLQKYLRRCSTEDVEVVLSSIQDELEDFVTNDYANYMLQSLVSACNVQQRTRIVVKLSKRMTSLSKNKKGTHCLQALIAKVLTPKEFKIIVSSVEKEFISLCEELNSAHFLLKIISSFPVEQLNNFYVEMLQPKSFLKLSQNQTAVLVIKAFMQKASGIEHMERVFIMLIASDLDTIIQDPFGNYVVQHAYEVYKQEVCRPITEKIVQKFTQYSIQKFSSCVVEKCVNLYFNDIQADILKSVCDNVEALEQMLKFTVASNILQKIVKRNKTHPIVQNICKVLSITRMSKYGVGWDHILYENKEKSATCKNSQGGNYSNFMQAVQGREKIKEPSKKGSKTPNLKN